MVRDDLPQVDIGVELGDRLVIEEESAHTAPGGWENPQLRGRIYRNRAQGGAGGMIDPAKLRFIAYARSTAAEIGERLPFTGALDDLVLAEKRVVDPDDGGCG